MGYSQAEKAQSRERILSAACAQIAREGMDSLGVAEVMKDAGLTAGTFYSHFHRATTSSPLAPPG